MIRLLYAKLDRLPKMEEMRDRLPSSFLRAYLGAHEKPTEAGIGGLYLAACARADGELTYDEKGRPNLTRGNYHDLSISHTAGYVFCALAGGEHHRVGLDAEDGGRVSEESMKKIARRFFTPEEQGLLLKSFELRKTFLELWTKKEAYAKYRGDGLSALLAGGLPKEEPCFFGKEIEGMQVTICTDTPLPEGFPTSEKVDSLVKYG